MESLLYAVASIGFFCWIVRNSFFWVDLWQKNAYSFKHLRRYVFQTPHGRSLLISPFSLFKWLILSLYPVVVLEDQYLQYYQWLVVFLFVVSFFKVLREMTGTYFFQKKNLSLKSFLIFIFAVTVSFLLYLFPLLDQFFWLLLIDRLLFFVILFFILGSMIPEEFYWDYQLGQVQQKIKSLPKLKTICFLGGSEALWQQEALASALREKHAVLTASGSVDKRALIKIIKEYLRPTTQYLLLTIAEPEQENLVQLVLLLHPKYVVITDPNYFRVRMTESIPALRTLFSQIQKAAGLTSQIYVAQTPLMKKLLHEMKKRRIVYYQPESFLSLNSLAAPIPQLLTAEGISPADIARLQTEKRPLQGRNSVEDRNEVTLIDSTGLAEPDLLSRYAAYLSDFTKQKILVISPQESVGRKWQEYYENLGIMLAKQFDYIFLTDPAFAKAVRKGVKSGKGGCQIVTLPLKKIANALTQTAEAGDVVLFYGADTAFVLTAYKKKQKTENPPSSL